MATVLSRNTDLLVVREQRSNIPRIAKLGSSTPENVVVVAQMQGEAFAPFASRVLGRCHRELARGHAPSQAIVCVDADVAPSEVAARRELLLALADILVLRPEAELSIVAPSRIGTADQIALFELVEVILRAAPTLNVRLFFGDSTDFATPRRRNHKGTRQPAAA
jgi:hypothetical protein